MPDPIDYPPRPAVPRELLLALAVAAAESRGGPKKLEIGAVFPPSASQLARIRLEALCYDIISSYAPPPAPSFSPPPPGADPVSHTELENKLAYAAFLARVQFKEALCAIMDSDDIFHLAPLPA